MSNRLFERAVRDWLEDGSDRTPQPAINAVLLAVKTTPQDRARWSPRRFTHMPSYLRLAASIAVVVVIGAGAIWYMGASPDVGAPGPSPTPSATSASSPKVTPSPTATPRPTFNPDPSTWTSYTSPVYGFETAYPKGWRVEQAAMRRWDPAVDLPVGSAPPTPAIDIFVNEKGDVAVSMWRAPADIEAIANSREAVIAWVEEFCDSSGNLGPCEGVAERAIPMCRERADCHPDAVIVPFSGDILAFFVGSDDALTIVQVWRVDSDPEVAPYGGAVNLLQAFLETMNVYVPEPGQLD